MAMVAVDLEHLYTVTAKGRTYHYAWRGKGAPRIKAEFGTPDFVEEYNAAHEGRKAGPAGKVAGLCASFRRSDAWNGRGRKPISEKTKASWTTWLDRIQDHFGSLSIKQFDRPEMRPRVEKWRDKYADTPRAADMGLQVLSRLLSFAQKEGLLLNNIVKEGGIERLYDNDRASLIWTEGDLAKLAAVNGPEITEAAALGALTGLRQSVLLRLGPSHRSENGIEIRSNKGRNGKPGKVVVIPLYAELRAFLDGLPRRNATTYLVNSNGLPWRTGFGSSWGTACDRAGIDALHFHDLRGTAATKFYSAGLSFREIAEILGWSEEDVEALINRYVKKDELLRDRIRRMDEYAARTQSAKPHAKQPSRGEA
jgi:integrase